MLKLLWRLWRHFQPRRRQQFRLLLILMVIASFAEVISIGAIIPFLAVLTSPSRLFVNASAQPWIRRLHIATPDQLVLPLAVGFAAAALVAGVMRLALLWATTRLSFIAGSDLSIDIYRRTLYQPYSVHLRRSSSEVINGISIKAIDVIYYTIVPVLTMISSGIMLVAIVAAMLFVNPTIAMIGLIGFGSIYVAISRLARSRLRRNSRSTARDSTLVIKSLQEGLGGIRDVLLRGRQEAFCEAYRRADQPLRYAQGSTLFISSSPRIAMESLGMIVIAAVAFLLSRNAAGAARAIPILGALGLGAQRLLPVLQQLYSSWSSMRGGQFALEDTLELLDQPVPDHVALPAPEPLPFRDEIALRGVSFRYAQDAPMVLRDIDLVIPKGSRVGFIGVTGSGKSTLTDILMGLLTPTEGTVSVDGVPITRANQRSWQVRIAHVPQSIFLADCTVEENIAFGIRGDLIDRKRVRRAAEQAQIAEAIESWSNGYDTIVGERGVLLSGGERQRIGIARALYESADVLVFDEATSALDGETEQAVMNAILSLDPELTILMIAHRLTTLRSCTHVVEIDRGRIVRRGSYREIVSHSA